MSIEPNAGFRARWPELLERIQNECMARTDIDACARVDLALEAEAIIMVSVTLPDGRAASRRVTRRDDVLPTLLALLLVPDHRGPAPTAAPPPTAAAPRRKPLIRRTSSTDRGAPPSSIGDRPLGFELSVITGARFGDGQLGVGAGALSFLELKRWLVGIEGRADSYRAIEGGDFETALELALLAGRRFDLGSVALDLTAGPGVAMKGFALSQAEASPAELNPSMAPPDHSGPSSGAVPRLLLGARLGFTPRSVFRTFVGIDGEVGPGRPRSDASSTRLPDFSLGLALGATVGTP